MNDVIMKMMQQSGQRKGRIANSMLCSFVIMKKNNKNGRK